MGHGYVSVHSQLSKLFLLQLAYILSVLTLIQSVAQQQYLLSLELVLQGYQSLKRYSKHHTKNHSKRFLNRQRAKNHINGVEGFWSYDKYILYHYRGGSKYLFRYTSRKSYIVLTTDVRTFLTDREDLFWLRFALNTQSFTLLLT